MVLLKIISFVMADTSSSRGLDDPGLDTRTRVDYDSDVIPNRHYSAIEESSDEDGQNFDTDDDGSSSDGWLDELNINQSIKGETEHAEYYIHDGSM